MQYKFPLKKILDFIPKNDSFSVRTRKDSPKEIRSRGIYMLSSPSFGIFYVGINASDNDGYNAGTPQRLRQHARKLFGITKHGTKQTRFLGATRIPHGRRPVEGTTLRLTR